MREGTEEAARLMEAGERDGAERVLLGLLEEHPEDARANYLMASLCDQSDRERRAVPFYRRALAGGEDLPEEDAAGAYLGLGSTHRALGEHGEAVSTLLKNLVETTDDPGIRLYGRALAFYADRLDETFE